MNDPTLIKAILVGNVRVGKTCIGDRVTSLKFDPDSVATIGPSFFSPPLITVGQTEVQLDLWDTAGQELVGYLPPLYFRRALAVVLVYSVCDEQSFARIDDWLERVQEHNDGSFVKFLVGNKTDLKEDRRVSFQTGQAKADEIQARFREVSARTGEGLGDFLDEIAKSCLELAVARAAHQQRALALEGESRSAPGHIWCCP
jgi:small GTP-binding protein